MYIYIFKCIEYLRGDTIKLVTLVVLFVHINIKSHDELVSLSLCRDPTTTSLLSSLRPLLVYSLPLPLSSPYCYLLNIH